MARRRCVYITDFGTQCKRTGTGQPTLCKQHTIAEGDDALQDILNGVAAHPRVASILDRVGNVLDKAARFIEQAPQYIQSAPGPSHHNVPPPRSPRQSNPTEDPRIVMGFSTAAVLTREIIKKRHHELARIIHSDTGIGSDESMKRLNAARDALLKQVK